jgi:bifunctional polynucleotide phosphatase/kinase
MIKNQYPEVDITNTFYCGDAAGRENDISAVDYKFALNLNIKFYTPEQLFLNSTTKIGYQYLDFNPKLYFKINYTPFYYKNTSQREVVILVGPPQSGKSTFAKKYFNNYDIVCNDNESLKHSKSRFKDIIKNTTNNIVVDGMHKTISNRRWWINIIIKVDPTIKITCIIIDIPIYVAKHIRTFKIISDKLNNINNNKKQLHINAIDSYYSRYEEPSLIEGFNEIIKIGFILDKSIPNVNILEYFLI